MKPDKIEKLGEEIRRTLDLNELIAYEALKIWEESPDDFCIQYNSGESIIFGSVNRVVWSPKIGFVIDEPYCTEKFIEHFRKWKNG